MPTITEQIEEIIDRRIGRNGFEGKGHLKAILEKKMFFEELLRLVDDYSTLRETILSQIREQNGEYYVMSIEDPTFLNKVEAADPSSVVLQLQKCLNECDRLEKRFNRDTINISVIGRARQGKSRLLQSISGLKDEVIPASNGGDCTGAKSIIANNKGDTYAKVVFYNEVELIEQIQKYLDSIGISRHIGSISQIKSLQPDVANYDSTLSSKTGKQQSLFQHLRKYVEHFDDYARFIGTVEDNVPESEIRNYVAQYDVNMKPTYAFLAVKEVLVFTQFPVTDAGKIVLVDTIGLGDTSLGIREKMIRTLRDDSDAAILVRLPSANGDSIRVEDDELYDLICEAMGVEALSKWLFFALNVCDALDNHNSGNAMEEALKARKLNFSFIKKVNCGDQVEVEKNLLLPILEYLSTNLSAVDNSLMKNANVQFTEAYQKYFDLCAKLQSVLAGGFKKSLQSGGLFDELYEDLELSRQIELLIGKYSDKNAECEVIRDVVKSVVRDISGLCPKPEDILYRLTSGGPDAYPDNVYNYFAGNLRASVRDEFEEINHSTIADLQEGFRNEVCMVLKDPSGGKLGSITLHMDSSEESPMDWLRHLIDEKLNDFPLIAEAFEDIYNYKLNIEGLLEYKADRSLDCLDPSPMNTRFLRPNFQGMSMEEIAEVIEQSLMNAIPIVADEIMTGIKELLVIPYNSFNARIRKLKDRIIIKKEGQRELRNFYRENATFIWANDFKNIAEKEVALGQLNEYCDKLAEKRVNNLFVLSIS